MTDSRTSIHLRPSWDEYFMAIADIVGSRATCDRGRSGCVIAKDKHILTTGYVGAPKGLPHCDEVGHEFHTVTNTDGSASKHCIRTTHAEQNAIVQGSSVGISLEGSTLYCYMTPCYICAKMIINAGIKKVIAKKDYHAGEQSKQIFKEAGIEYILLENIVEQYEHM